MPMFGTGTCIDNRLTIIGTVFVSVTLLSVMTLTVSRQSSTLHILILLLFASLLNRRFYCTGYDL